MKLQLSSIKPKSLNARGISHLMVPLLIVLTIAVGGTFMMVSSKAATSGTGGVQGPAESATAKPKKTKKPKIDPNTSKLLIYSAKGSYKSVKIVSSSKEGKIVNAKCNQAPKEVNGKIKKTPTLKKYKFDFSKAKVDAATKKETYTPIIVICQDPEGTATKKEIGESYLKVVYSRYKKSKSKYTGDPVLVAGHDKECVFVHWKGVTDRTKVSFTDGECKKSLTAGAASNDADENDEAPDPNDPVYLRAI